MPKRLATEYVKACLRFSGSEMSQFMGFFNEHRVSATIKVCENGNQELVLNEESGDIVLTFEREANEYVCQGSFRVNSPRLTDFFRKLVSAYKGDAIVRRIYASFCMVYYYERGTVVKIVELSEQSQRTIYEYKQTSSKLRKLFESLRIEAEIGLVHMQINGLLDQRNETRNPDLLEKIDLQLEKLAHQLFVLEA
ncbi:non-ribosomal peptide synthetase module [Ferviditalea candida]|uniref:Non-ribosomal peptide synthetase module n=1 Tax=Ferviditalea candida TaxID=3108399 RepID=A0ABU5ZD36_9BACL|nr:non-ribosomal peptide synthetase module [Paenibacillaceae bacterium T2]